MGMRGWQTFVYRTDVETEKFCGAFFDEDAAQKWADKQEEGTYEVSTERPTRRQARLGEGSARQEAARE